MKKLILLIMLAATTAFGAGSPAVVCPPVTAPYQAPPPLNPTCDFSGNVSAAQINYTTTPVGSYLEKTAIITNNGGGTLTGSASVSGADYSITSGSGAYSLTAGQSKSIVVRFSPVTGGARLGTLLLGGGTCSNITLLGIGNNTPSCSILPTTSIGFGNVEVGSTKDDSVSIKNVGGGSLTGTVAESCNDFSIISGSGAFSLAYGESVIVKARFSPAAEGLANCTITNGTSCSDISCTGTGTITPPSSLFEASDLEYLGAFQFKRSAPSGGGDSLTLSFGGTRGLTFRPTQASDPSPNDGYPGTLFMNMYDATCVPADGCTNNGSGKVCEQSIPVPVISQNIGSLNNPSGVLHMATVVQNGAALTGSLFRTSTYSIRRWGGLLYLPQMGSQTSPKLYWSFYDAYNVANQDRITHGWSNVDFSDRSETSTSIDAKYAWHVGTRDDGNYLNPYHYLKSSGFFFEIPDAFANTYLGGKKIAGGWCYGRESGTQGGSSGPSLIAFSPWLNGNPPTNGSNVDATALLYYQRHEGLPGQNCATPPTSSIIPFDLSDTYTGGAWMDHNSKQSVLFVGTRCQYTTHYYDGCDGCPPGLCWSDQSHTSCVAGGCCDGCDEDDGACHENKGFTCGNEGQASPAYRIYFVLYDPNDFALVATGNMGPEDPQPYLTIDLSNYMWPGCQVSTYGVAYDRAHGLLYVAQSGIDNTQSSFQENAISVCHVFRFN